MKPTREQIELIALDWSKYHKIIDEFEKVLGILAPSSYEPIIDFYDPFYTVKILCPDIHENIEYRYRECRKPMPVTYQDGTVIVVRREDITTLKELLLKEELITDG